MQYKYLRVVLKYSTRVDVVTDIIFRAPDFSIHKKRWLKNILTLQKCPKIKNIVLVLCY